MPCEHAETCPSLSVAACLELQVDGFRWDIMGHHMVSTMKKVQQALGQSRLQPDAGGLYMYGEAWDFGEVSTPGISLLLLGCQVHAVLTCRS